MIPKPISIKEKQGAEMYKGFILAISHRQRMHKVTVELDNQVEAKIFVG